MNESINDKPMLVLDFDGVLHSYTNGWKGAGLIPDPPVDGAQNFCERALEHFRIWIISSRCCQEGGTEAIRRWLIKYNFPPEIHVSSNGVKPPAFLTIDDRALPFNGVFYDPEKLLEFEPWTKREAHKKFVMDK